MTTQTITLGHNLIRNGAVKKKGVMYFDFLQVPSFYSIFKFMFTHSSPKICCFFYQNQTIHSIDSGVEVLLK